MKSVAVLVAGAYSMVTDIEPLVVVDIHMDTAGIASAEVTVQPVVDACTELAGIEPWLLDHTEHAVRSHVGVEAVEAALAAEIGHIGAGIAGIAGFLHEP